MCSIVESVGGRFSASKRTSWASSDHERKCKTTENSFLSVLYCPYLVAVTFASPIRKGEWIAGSHEHSLQYLNAFGAADQIDGFIAHAVESFEPLAHHVVDGNSAHESPDSVVEPDDGFVRPYDQQLVVRTVKAVGKERALFVDGSTGLGAGCRNQARALTGGKNLCGLGP